MIAPDFESLRYAPTDFAQILPGTLARWLPCPLDSEASAREWQEAAPLLCPKWCSFCEDTSQIPTRPVARTPAAGFRVQLLATLSRTVLDPGSPLLPFESLLIV